MNALALIIGNSKYPDNELKNPENDAVDFSVILTRLGFTTILHVNIDQENLNKEIDSFGKDLENYDIGLFYFAGHGMQIEGENFLTVVNTNFESETSVQYSSITLNKILTFMERAQNKTNIIILDACRDNPFEKQWTRSISQSGLAPIYAPKGTLIAYATSPGQRAKDGIGRNGLYTSALLKHILDENITVEEFFKRVRNSVFAFSSGKQTSWEHTSLTGTFLFNSGQLIHSVDTPYSSNVIADVDIKLNYDNNFDKILIALKSHNWYIQNPAIKSISKLNPNEIDNNKLFLLGRNVLQSADGCSSEAIDYVHNLEKNLPIFNINSQNHVLNGILFEMYFDNNGKFRNKGIKGIRFINNIIELAKLQAFENSFLFIQSQIKKIGNPLFYIPSNNSQTISFDVVYDKVKNELSKEDEFYIKNIKYEGQDVLIPDPKNPYFSENSMIYYDHLIYKNLKEKISQLTGVPDNLITINTNFEMNEDSKIKFPFGYQIKKNSIYIPAYC
jgi:Caspase domain